MLIEAAAAFPAPLAVFLLAMSPIWEVRMSIPVGILLYDMHWVAAFGISFAGNMVIVPVLHLLLPAVERRLRRNARVERWWERRIEKLREKRGANVERMREAAVFALIAIPVPGTGAWTGAFMAKVFDMRYREALPFYAAGIATACAITTILVEAGRWGVNQL